MLLLLAQAVDAQGDTGRVSFRNEVMPVLSKSGCNAGTCHGNAYDGAAKLLRRIGAILGGNLPSHKARIKLMLLLAAGADVEQVRRSFEVC